jgi:hypothetical protein
MASMPLPDKYSSKKNTLLITTTSQESCAADRMSSSVVVGGVTAQGGANYNECGDNGGFETFTRTWEVPSEAQGGTAIAAGSTVDLHMSSMNGTAQRALINIQAVAVK